MTEHPLYTIVIVDDNPNNLFTLRTLLEQNLDATVISADSGPAALDVISRQPAIDLIMLDIQMPGMNGFEVAELLRSRKKYSAIPIIFLTAVYTTDDFKHEGLQQGAIDYLTKPIDDVVLLTRIKAHLRLIETERALNRELQAVNAQLQQEIEERRRIEDALRDAKDQALAAQGAALAAKQAEQAARLAAEQAQVVAEAANRAKSEFLRTMSHELKTPLNGILGYAQILSHDPDLRADHREKLDIIRRSGEHLLTLLNDILDISNIDTGQLRIEPRAFHLPALVRNLLDMARIQAHAKGLSIRYQAPEALPEIVYGDEGRLRQVLLHLLGNAIKFTAQGHISLHVSLDDEFPTQNRDASTPQPLSAAPTHRLRFEIADTGIGIAPAQFERIFRPFERVSDTNTYTEGAGLGLALSQRLLAMMDSRLHVDSRPGQGSRFWFELAFAALPAGSASYDEAARDGGPVAEQPVMPLGTLPPPPELDALLEAAGIGDISAILAHLQELEQQTPIYQPFIDRIRALAQSFQLKQISRVITTCRRQESA